MNPMKAERLFYDKAVFPDGYVVEMVIWRVASSVPPTTHGLKYRLVYGHNGERVVGSDNERGKGDHRHHRSRESRYRFVSVEALIGDFLADVERERSKT
jgi:hypothetical protein